MVSWLPLAARDSCIKKAYYTWYKVMSTINFNHNRFLPFLANPSKSLRGY